MIALLDVGADVFILLVKRADGEIPHVRIEADDLHLRAHPALHAFEKVRLFITAVTRQIVDRRLRAVVPEVEKELFFIVEIVEQQ